MSVPSRMDSTPIAVFTPCSNSHPFDERRIPVTRSEENAVKIGRAVARLQPVENNAIFDCKVRRRQRDLLFSAIQKLRHLITFFRSSHETTQSCGMKMDNFL
jgi:hypothetical protein